MAFLQKLPSIGFFRLLIANNLNLVLLGWVNSISELSKGQIIAMNGKSIRGAKSHGKKSSIHMVSAWACDNNLVFGQVKTAKKSNKITAIPELLNKERNHHFILR